MRCNTPGIRKLARSNLGYKLKNKPRPMSTKPRYVILAMVLATGCSLFESPIAKAMDTPTMNKKNGKIKSVGVQPFQWACSSGA